MSTNTTEPLNLDPIIPHLTSLLTKRSHPKTLCPSEAARALTTSDLARIGVSSWRDVMTPLRVLCFDLRDQGQIEVMQKGEVLPVSQGVEETRGPIRIRKKLV